MRLILPVSGLSSRYPGLRPKWLLTHPNGNLMVAESIRGLKPECFDEVVVVCLEEHCREYGAAAALEKQFLKTGLLEKLRVTVIERSESQPHTVYQALVRHAVDGPIFIKDSDNYFQADPRAGNVVCYVPIGDLMSVNAANKSYVLLSEDGVIQNIVEKRIISSTFCAGGYGFADAGDFITAFERIRDLEGLYISHVIYQLMVDGRAFHGHRVNGFVDWGTLHDWNDYRSRFCTLFIDLDGTLVESSGEFLPPHWGETGAIEANVRVVNRLFDSGFVQVIVTTSRSEETDELTRTQLAGIGLKYHKIIYGLFHARRIVVNDYSRSNPYKSCDAVNLRRNSPELEEMLDAALVRGALP